ncbi:vesicle transport protein USE1 [Nerophis ophidion]|uniref:vesicle transport protein USE1 n=1 Tax=Nerophis ophidion TaxID=159077 RepID=UPI002ADF086F|nr:vesicle transport protein USE1 [Nerophis ophidion]XP_061739121.1 vesicle transport protein USE1 [Nerophis ophidion]XP_061739122.1 vesicle transport protein USE1 [Nerophis ophidion]
MYAVEKRTSTNVNRAAPPLVNMASRLEINFVRLLSRCESIASDKRAEAEWRLEKYVGALEEMLVALRKSTSKPTAEVLTEYTRKVDFLKGLLEAEKLSSPTEKALANQFLAPGRTPTIAQERMPVTKTVHMQTKARCTGQMRDELLGTDLSSKETDLRNRRGLPLDERQSAAELDAILAHQHNLQEKIAEDMLNLARNLKNNTLAAQSIIKQDNQTLGQSMRQADVNLEKLKTESERLEQHAKKSVNWLLWLMLVLVSFTFISMILFIRLFPRLR